MSLLIRLSCLLLHLLVVVSIDFAFAIFCFRVFSSGVFYFGIPFPFGMFPWRRFSIWNFVLSDRHLLNDSHFPKMDLVISTALALGLLDTFGISTALAVVVLVLQTLLASH